MAWQREFLLTSPGFGTEDYDPDPNDDDNTFTLVRAPSWAKYATFTLNVIAMSGTTELIDMTLQRVVANGRNPDLTPAAGAALDATGVDHPPAQYSHTTTGSYTDASLVDMPGLTSGITQITAAGIITITIGPGITGIADDDTGPDYNINATLPPLMHVNMLLDNGTQDEIYQFVLYVDWSD